MIRLPRFLRRRPKRPRQDPAAFTGLSASMEMASRPLHELPLTLIERIPTPEEKAMLQRMLEASQWQLDAPAINRATYRGPQRPNMLTRMFRSLRARFAKDSDDYDDPDD